MRLLTRSKLGGAFLALAIPAYSGVFNADFNSNTAPAGTTVQGTADGGVVRTDLIEDGVLKITKALNGQAGSIIINDLDDGAPVYGFEFSAKVLLGGGTSTPADGFSISFDPLITDGQIPNEDGTPDGITFSFDIYNNGNETPPAPSIDLKVGNALVATRNLPFADLLTGGEWVDLHIVVAPDGGTSLEYKGMTIFDNVYFANYQPISGGRFAIGGRTGGLNANQWFDDIEITTFTAPHVGIIEQPVSQTFVAGSDAVIRLQTRHAEEASFQWFRGEDEVSGATSQDLVLSNVSAADDGAQYSLRITGPNNTVTSDTVTVSVADVPVPASPEMAFDFEEGTGVAPAGTSLWGTGYIDTATGVLHITDNVNDQRSTFIIENDDAGAPIYGFTATFDALLGSGSGRPADGFSFNLAEDIVDDPPGELEEGVGTGLSVVFDIYDNLNGGGEAPALEVKYRGQLVASEKLPFSFFDTGTEFVPVIIRVESDGTIDVAYRNVVVFENLSIPGFTSVSNGRFALAGRTGGQNINMWFDNIEITTDNIPGDLRIATLSPSLLVASGTSASFTVSANTEDGVTYQWLKDGAEISGATEPTLTIDAAAASDDAEYSVRVTRNGASVTSEERSLTVLDFTSPTVSFDFETDETPVGTTLYRAGESPDFIAGYISGGVLHLTDNWNSISGGFVVSPLLAGAQISAFSAAFDLRMGGGSGNPADGFTFNYAGDIGEGTAAGGGAGSGLTIEFDIYDNGGGEAPSIDVEYKNQLVAQTKFSKAAIQTGDDFREVVVNVSADGKLDLSYGGVILHEDLQLPNYEDTVAGKFGFYAWTGGENENFWVDNIRLDVTKSADPLAITDEPDDILVLAGQTASFNILVNDPTGASYRWFRDGVEISGATSATFTTPVLNVGDDGARYTVTVTSPTGTVESREAVLTVADPIAVTNPDVSYNFDDDLTPEGTFLNSAFDVNIGQYSGYVYAGAIHLTDAVNSQTGTFIVPDLNAGEPVNAFTVAFDLLIGGSTGTPADGVAFVWGSDFEDNATFREQGAGNGLIVSFDTYLNAGEPSPAIEIFYNGALVASRAFPNSFVRTGDTFEPVSIRLEPDGTVDVQYRDTAIFHNVQLPGFTPMTGAKFGFGAGTGGAVDNHWIDNVQIAASVGEAVPEITNITEANGEITISWTGGGTLEATDDLASGDWDELTGAQSPYTTSNTGDMRFFRVVR